MPITYYTEDDIEQIKEQHETAIREIRAEIRAETYAASAHLFIRAWILRENLHTLTLKELRTKFDAAIKSR